MERNKKQCSKCGKEISLSNIKKHEKSCGQKKHSSIDESWKQQSGKYKCPFCSKEYTKAGISTHIWRTHGEGKDFDPNIGYKNGRVVWNKGLTKEDERILKRIKTLKERFKTGMYGNRFSFPHSEKTKMRLSELAIKRKFGGVTRSRRIKHKNKILGSSYELEVAVSLEENGIKWETCDRFNYVDVNGKKRTYTPDFYLPDYDVYLDPKNDFLINNINPALGYKDSEKIKWAEEQNGVIIIILNKKELNWNSIKEKIATIVQGEHAVL